MQVVSGTVIGGKVVVSGGELPEGSKVTVITQDAGEAFQLTEEQEQELLASIDEADRGESVDGYDLLRQLRGE